MQTNNPLDNTTVLMDDFNLEHCNAIIQGVICPHARFSSIFSDYTKAFACAAQDTQYSDSQKAIWAVMSIICSVCYDRSHQTKGNGQYQPSWIMSGRRSFLPEDLNEHWQALIRDIAVQLDEFPLIQGRLLDVCYVAAERKNFQHIQPIVTAFAKTDVLTHDGYDCWWRMLGLLKSTNKAGTALLNMHQQALFDLFEAQCSAPALDEQDQVQNIYDIARLCYEHRLLTPEQRKTIADGLKATGLAQLSKEVFLWADHLFSLAHDYYQRLGLKNEQHDMLRQRAQAYIANGDARLRENVTGVLVQHTFYEKALQVLRSLPKNERTEQDTQKINELFQEIPQLGQQLLAHMHPQRTHLRDVTELTESAREYVQGCGVWEALQRFIGMSPFFYSKHREDEKKNRNFVIDYFYSDSGFADDGRTVAKRERMDIANKQNVEQTIWKKMVRLYHEKISPDVVNATILPTLEVILSEHRIPIEGLLSLTTQSKFVPVNRRYLWAKGLAFGFEYDFSSALYCLTPQIEHMVRDALKQRNIKTTTTSLDNIETENGLSTLLENHLDECVEVFGEDVTYEMKILLCDAWGANLRNMAAHGLLNDNESCGHDAVYLWWFALKLVILGGLPQNDHDLWRVANSG